MTVPCASRPRTYAISFTASAGRTTSLRFFTSQVSWIVDFSIAKAVHNVHQRRTLIDSMPFNTYSEEWVSRSGYDALTPIFDSRFLQQVASSSTASWPALRANQHLQALPSATPPYAHFPRRCLFNSGARGIVLHCWKGFNFPIQVKERRLVQPRVILSETSISVHAATYPPPPVACLSQPTLSPLEITSRQESSSSSRSDDLCLSQHVSTWTSQITIIDTFSAVRLSTLKSSVRPCSTVSRVYMRVRK